MDASNCDNADSFQENGGDPKSCVSPITVQLPVNDTTINIVNTNKMFDFQKIIAIFKYGSLFVKESKHVKFLRSKGFGASFLHSVEKQHQGNYKVISNDDDIDADFDMECDEENIDTNKNDRNNSGSNNSFELNDNFLILSDEEVLSYSLLLYNTVIF